MDKTQIKSNRIKRYPILSLKAKKMFTSRAGQQNSQSFRADHATRPSQAARTVEEIIYESPFSVEVNGTQYGNILGSTTVQALMTQCGASQLLYSGNVVDINQTMSQLGATEGARFTTQSTWIGGLK